MGRARSGGVVSMSECPESERGELETPECIVVKIRDEDITLLQQHVEGGKVMMGKGTLGWVSLLTFRSTI